MDHSPRSRLLLALGAGCFFAGGATGWRLRDAAPTPPAAARQLPRGEVRKAVPANAADATAEKPPAAALAGVALAGVARDRRAALGWILQNNPPSADDHTLRDAFLAWTKSSPDAALAWAFALPAGKARDEIMPWSLGRLAETDPRRAVTLLATKLSAESQAEAAFQIAAYWSDHDPAAAAAWAGQLPEGWARLGALGSVAEKWGEADPEAAAQWIGGFPAGPDRDQAVASFSEKIASEEPESGLAWAATIGDAEARTEVVRRLTRQWLERVGAEARKWLLGTDQLTPAAKAKLLEEDAVPRG